MLSGHLRGGEIFETGWWGQGDLFGTDDGCTQQAQSVRDSLQTSTFAQGISVFWDDQTGIDQVMVYGYPSGGPKAGVMGQASVTGVVGAESGVLPLQACLVATLLTGKPGRSYRGRMYWPATGLQVSNNQAIDGRVSALATLTAELLAPTTGSGPGPVVVSQRHTTFTPITHVRVDSKIDIQRRRAQGESPTYTHTV